MASRVCLGTALSDLFALSKPRQPRTKSCFSVHIPRGRLCINLVELYACERGRRLRTLFFKGCAKRSQTAGSATQSVNQLILSAKTETTDSMGLVCSLV